MSIIYKTELGKLIQGDCLQQMKDIKDKSIDLILCDLPYGVTKNKWDSVISLIDLWNEYERIIKDNGAVVLFAQQPFTTELINSNRKLFRYCLVWDKVGTTGFQTAKIMPLKRHEDIVVFYKKKPTYNPIMEERGKPRKKGGSKTDNGCYGELRSKKSYNNLYYPTSIITISNANKLNRHHPTEKPLELCKYLVRTFSNNNDVILDNTCGSGSILVACEMLNRKWIGIELDTTYCNIAKNRLQNIV